MHRSRPRVERIDRAWLARAPLPEPEEGGDKEERGRVLVVGGSREMAGAVVLAANAALRAGAGKLQIATAASVASLVGALVPEARVFPFRERKDGGPDEREGRAIADRAKEVQAVLVGPGMIGEVAPFLDAFVTALARARTKPVLVLDADPLAWLARPANRRKLHALGERAIVTPHAGEMATLLGVSKGDVTRARPEIAARAASELRAVVALKGEATYVATPHGDRVLENRAGNVGLATSGSGDTLAGVVTGLAARGADPLRATAWAVHLHARAGDALAARQGELGFLARELLAELPSVMNALAKAPRVRAGSRR